MDPVCRQRGFAIGEILTHWADIVGPAFADHCQPVKLRWPHRESWDDARTTDQATLIVHVSGFHALQLQHQAPLIVERINQFFGYQAIGQLRLEQRIVTTRPRLVRGSGKKLQPLDKHSQKKLDAQTDAISDQKLAAAIARLGRGVLSINKR